ncbi:predicted GPI-anchored protein 58 [Miscanthus floridulus]|uniref:predicted GPI-anchored protein 58 n=1 Tax=Miscanthus floridulus TaxID=154761 RepID=UPI00345A0EDC
MAHGLLKSQNMLAMFWREAVATAIFLLNGVPTKGVYRIDTIGGTPQRGDLTPPAGPAHTPRTHARAPARAGAADARAARPPDCPRRPRAHMPVPPRRQATRAATARAARLPACPRHRDARPPARPPATGSPPMPRAASLPHTVDRPAPTPPMPDPVPDSGDRDPDPDAARP